MYYLKIKKEFKERDDDSGHFTVGQKFEKGPEKFNFTKKIFKFFS